MSDFGRGLLLGSPIFRQPDQSDQIDQLFAQIEEAEGEIKGLCAEIVGTEAVANALKRALYEAVPDHPLVAPYAIGKNPLRTEIYKEAFKQAIKNPSFKAADEIPVRPANIWRSATEIEKKLRADYELYVAQLQAQHEAENKQRDAEIQRLNSDIQEKQKRLIQSVACAAGSVEVTNTLIEALAKENPDNPLVNPFADGDNIVREQIFQKGRQEMMV